MPRARTNKLYRTFTKGLITEASYLTYPEDASIDELNTVISRKGNRTRRTGIDFQNGYVLEDLDITQDVAINEFVWTSASNNPAYNFVVIQAGTKIYFYALNEGPVSANKKAFTIDLTQFVIPGINTSKMNQHFASFSAGAGFLFIAHRMMDPVSVEYKIDTDTIDVQKIIVQIRDFDGLDDGLDPEDEPTQLSFEHYYNLLNQGWVGPGNNTTTGTGNTETDQSGNYYGNDGTNYGGVNQN